MAPVSDRFSEPRNTLSSPTDFYPLEEIQLMRFDGKSWVRFGEVIGR